MMPQRRPLFAVPDSRPSPSAELLADTLEPTPPDRDGPLPDPVIDQPAGDVAANSRPSPPRSGAAGTDFPGLSAPPLAGLVDAAAFAVAPDPGTGGGVAGAVQAAAGGVVTSGSSVGTGGAISVGAPAAASRYGLTGSGLRIGIISDSFDAATATARASAPGTPYSATVMAEAADGDLPDVVDLGDDASGTDEGRAIAELVHAAAPGAQLYFITAGSLEIDSANAVASLVALGANVILDDVSWLSSPLFQDGSPLQSAVEAATAAGVSYFTSAGNLGTHFYQSTVGAGATRTIVVGASQSLTFDLQWTQPFLSINGNAGPAYSLGFELLVHGTSSVAYSSDVDRRGYQDPVQEASFLVAAGTYDLVILADHGTPTASDLFKVVILAPDYSSISMTAGTGSGALIGQELVGSANVIGAVDAGNAADVEAFSSAGPGQFYASNDGTLLAQPTGGTQPTLLAGDRVATSVAGFGDFAGTSAAVASAAGAGALLLQLDPSLTPADLQRILQTTAGSAGLVGSAAQIGDGLIDADAAAQLIVDGTYVAGGTTLYNGTATAFDSILSWSGGSGGWTTAVDWNRDSTPVATSYATLGDDFGTATASYTVTLSSLASTVDTLTVGDAASLPATLAIGSGGTLAVGEGATVGQAGTLTLGAGGSLAVAGLLRLDDVTGSSAALTVAASAGLGAGSLALVGGVLTAFGTVGIAGAGSIAASGSLVVGGGGLVSLGGTLSGVAGASVTVNAGGTLSVLNAQTLAATLAFGSTLEVQTTDSFDLNYVLDTLVVSVAVSAGATAAQVVLAGLTYDAATDRLAFAAAQSPNATAGAVSVVRSGGTLATFDVSASQGIGAANLQLGADPSGHLEVSVACFCTGTRIAVPGGEVAVEALAIGDLVLTASGAARPIRWIGRRRYGAGTVAASRRLQPIRIAAGRLGAGLPRRDLLVSPQHALLLQGAAGPVLVPAALLVDGDGIARCRTPGAVAYVHLELDTHDAVLAEGQAAESFADHDSRAGFDNAAEFAALHPGAADAGGPGCAPRVEGGAELAWVRAALAVPGRAGRMDGCLDRADGAMIEGWAWSPEAPAAPVLLEILVEGECVAVLLADQFRADLAAMNGGDCAFYFTVPPGLRVRPDGVTVRRAGDGWALSGPERLAA